MIAGLGNQPTTKNYQEIQNEQLHRRIKMKHNEAYGRAIRTRQAAKLAKLFLTVWLTATGAIFVYITIAALFSIEAQAQGYYLQNLRSYNQQIHEIRMEQLRQQHELNSYRIQQHQQLPIIRPNAINQHNPAGELYSPYLIRR